MSRMPLTAMADPALLPQHADPVNVYRRSLFTRLIGPASAGVSLFFAAALLASPPWHLGFLAFWLVIFAGALYYSAVAWSDAFELHGNTLVYRAPLARLLGRPVVREFPLRDCALKLHERRTLRMLAVRLGREHLLIEGIESFDEFVGRVEQAAGVRLRGEKAAA